MKISDSHPYLSPGRVLLEDAGRISQHGTERFVQHFILSSFKMRRISS